MISEKSLFKVLNHMINSQQDPKTVISTIIIFLVLSKKNKHSVSSEVQYENVSVHFISSSLRRTDNLLEMAFFFQMLIVKPCGLAEINTHLNLFFLFFLLLWLKHHSG